MKKSKVLLAGNVSALIVILIQLTLFVEFLLKKSSDFEALISAVLLVFLIPSLIFMGIGLLLGIKAYQKNNRWLTLSSFILYLLAAILVLNFGIFMVPTLILTMTAYLMQVKQFREAKDGAAGLLP